MKKYITPDKNDEYVRTFAKSLDTKGDLFCIDVCPEKWSKEIRCFENVNNKIKQSGGEEIQGWIIWQWPNILLQAEYHSVWKSFDNLLIDITPHGKNIDRILFGQTDSKKYLFNQSIVVPVSHMEPICADEIVKEYCNSCVEYQSLQNQFKLNHKNDDDFKNDKYVKQLFEKKKFLYKKLILKESNKDVC